MEPGRVVVFLLMSFSLFLSLLFLLFFFSTSILTFSSSSGSNGLPLGPEEEEEEESRLFFLTSFCLCLIFEFFFVLAIEPGGTASFEPESELEDEDEDDEEDEEDERFEESLSVSSFFAATEGGILLASRSAEASFMGKGLRSDVKVVFESDRVSSFEETSGSWSLNSSSISFESDYFALGGSKSADLTLSLSHSCPQMGLVK